MRYYDLPLQMAPKDDRTISRQVSRKDRRPAERARLRVIFPPTAIAMAELGPVACEIGRAPDGGGILIDNPTISRRHVEVRWAPEAGAHTICDLVSRNGSWRNGERIGEQPVPLHDGDLVRIGDVFFVYEVGSALNAADSRLVSTDAIPGEAASVAQLRGQLAMAAIDAAPLLIVGETGTGKELIAREAHRLSRRTGELVVVNCAALSPQLIESQLFGHVRGAFTGATEAQAGLFRAAAGGTLFLDEIGELPLELQPKLLRAIEMREVQPVGATKAVQVDVRVIAATHRRLDAAVEAGQFRRDLYARLSLWELRVPPLGRRRADTLEWLHRFWRRRYGEASTLTIEPDAVDKLLLAAWPTNLRGLDRLVHELDGLAKRNRPLHAADVPTWVTEAPASAASEPAVAPTPQKPPIPSRDEFIAAYEQCRGSVRALAKHFDRDRRQIYRWLEQHGLRGSSMG